MEGVSGVTNWNHVSSSHAEYGRFRKLMTGEVNAAITGAVAGGAETVVVSDGHDAGGNILLEELDPLARLNTGSPSPFSMVQGIGPDADGAVFIGYHARVGTPLAILDHTWSGTTTGVWLNHIEVGEIGLNAAMCGHFGVPVIAVSGCRAACAEATALLGEVETAPVKEATSRNAAECLTPEASRQLIESAVQRAAARLAAGSAPAPYRVATPIELTVEFANSGQADGAARLPGAERDGRRVTYRAADMPATYQAFRVLTSLAA